MNARGHNENAMRLGMLADDAAQALGRVADSEASAIDAWLAYGAALNEGRSLFPSDEQFGQWLVTANLAETHDHERAAAMWGAANRDDFEVARAAGNARTVRGIHAKWKEIEAERIEEQRRVDEEARQQQPIDDVKAASGDPQSIPDQAGTIDTQQPDTTQTVVEAETGTTPKPDDQEPEAIDPHRKGLSMLTRDGLEDEVAGLRADLADAIAARSALEVELSTFKQRVSDLSQSNQGATISRLQNQIADIKRARDNAIEKAAKEIRRANFMEKQWKEARTSLESQEVEI